MGGANARDKKSVFTFPPIARAANPNAIERLVRLYYYLFCGVVNHNTRKDKNEVSSGHLSLFIKPSFSQSTTSAVAWSVQQ